MRLHTHTRTASRQWLARAAFAAAVIIGTASLGGCGQGASESQPPAGSGASASPSGDATASSAPRVGPQVGDCWFEKNYKVAHTWRSWQGADHVDCSAKHNSITYAVKQFGEDWRLPPEKEAWPTRWVLALRDTCKPFQTSKYLTTFWRSRVETYYYLPTKSQWAKGERWLRCDVGIRRVGSTVAYQTTGSLEDLPATLEEIRAVRDQNYSLSPHSWCIKGSGDAFDEKAVYVSCNGQRTFTWYIFEERKMKQPLGAPYPSDQVMETAWHRACWPIASKLPGSDLNVQWPSETSWLLGDRAISCYLGVGS